LLPRHPPPRSPRTWDRVIGGHSVLPPGESSQQSRQPRQARPRRPGRSSCVQIPPGGVQRHAITGAVTAVTPDAGILPATTRAISLRVPATWRRHLYSQTPHGWCHSGRSPLCRPGGRSTLDMKPRTLDMKPRFRPALISAFDPAHHVPLPSPQLRPHSIRVPPGRRESELAIACCQSTVSYGGAVRPCWPDNSIGGDRFRLRWSNQGKRAEGCGCDLVNPVAANQ